MRCRSGGNVWIGRYTTLKTKGSRDTNRAREAHRTRTLSCFFKWAISLLVTLLFREQLRRLINTTIPENFPQSAPNVSRRVPQGYCLD